MSGRIPRDFIDDLLLRVDIVDLIDSHVPLKKSGSNFVARCPFHSEKTPSFSVSRKKQLYHCFGCGASGNALGFLMAFSHLDFVEAVEDLASIVGIDVPREQIFERGDAKKSDLARLYATLEGVAKYYAAQLGQNPEARKSRDYLVHRGVNSDSVRNFSLGYAPEFADSLLSQFPSQDLIDAGVLARSDSGRLYDRFHGRLMFPIRDRRGRVIGFGGRVLGDAQPKYLNSPETIVFSKSKEVYGLPELLEAGSKPERILVVEGYMDVIALSQTGIQNVVATLGTSTSKLHLDLLFRFTSELVFCFDGDNAGRQAAWRAVDAALPCLRDGRQIGVMLLPQGHDPDSLVKSEGLQPMVERISNALPLSEYFFEYINKDLNLNTLEGCSQLVVAARPFIEKIPSGIFKDMMLARLSKLSQVPILEVSANASTITATFKPAHRKNPAKPSLARVVVALLVQNPKLAELLQRLELNWKDLQFPGADLLADVLRTIELEKPENTAILLERYRNSPHEKTLNALASLNLSIPEGGENAELSGAMQGLLRQAQEVDLNRLLEKEQQEGLAPQEKEQLRRLLKQKL